MTEFQSIQEKNQEATNALMAMGDHLYSLQRANPSERDNSGFNSIDMGLWNRYRGDYSAMMMILKKYNKQLNQLGYEVDLSQFPKLMPELSFSDFQSALEINLVNRFDKETFKGFISVIRQYGFVFSFNRNFLPRVKLFEFKNQWNEFVKDIEEIGIFPPDKMPDLVANALEYTEAVKLRDALIYRKTSKKIVVVIKENNFFCFYCGFNPIFNQIFSNKSGVLTGISEYDPKTHSRKVASIELCIEAIAKIQTMMPDYEIIKEGIEEAYQEHQAILGELSKPNPLVTKWLSPEFVLRPYQNRGVNFFIENEGRAILGDKMGLGKTLQTLAYVASTGGRVLIACPKVVRKQWLEEAVKFFPKYFEGYTLEIRADKLIGNIDNPRIGTITYKSVVKYQEALLKLGFTIFALDESHLIKNKKTKANQAIFKLRDHFKGRICLSGTAVENKKKEFFEQIEFVRPGLFNKDELSKGTIGGVWNKLVSTVYLCRTKAEVLKDLPPKQTTILDIECEGMPNYPNNIGEMSSTRVVAGLAMADNTIEFVNDLLKSGERNILVFSESIEAVRKIYQNLEKDAIIHHGELTDNQREKAKKSFQNREKRVFVTTRQSMSVGANMTQASIVIFNDLPWKATDIQQAEDRTHRIGQTENVDVYWMTTSSSAWCKRVSEILKRKYDLCKKMNDGKQLTKDEIRWMNESVQFEEVANYLKENK